MTLSDLETELKALDASLLGLSTKLAVISCLLVFCTAVVVAGLIVEYAPDFRQWRYGRPRDRRSPWPVRVGAILIIIGIVGELGFTFWSFKVESDIKTVNSKIERDLKAEIKVLGLSALDGANRASEAIETAKQANDESGKARTKSGEAMSLARTADQEANSARKDVGVASEQLAQLRKDAQSLQAEANKTKSELTDVAVCNAPRVITRWSVAKTGATWSAGNARERSFITGPSTSGKSEKSYVEPLVPMAGQVVFIEYVPDAEARRAALNIMLTLLDAKWNVQGPIRPVDWLQDGVSIEPSEAGTTSAKDQSLYLSAFSHASDAAEKLEDFLHSYNWYARIEPPTDEHGKWIHDPNILPPGAIRIQVGLYPPMVYVSPPGQRELNARFQEYEREKEKFLAEVERKEEEGRPPEFRKALEQHHREWEAEMRHAESTRNGPCQVLDLPF